MMKKLLMTSAIAIMMAICTSCTPSGEYIVVGKEIRGRYNDRHVLILRSTYSGEMYSKYVNITRYYNVEAGDTITIN